MRDQAGPTTADVPVVVEGFETFFRREYASIVALATALAGDRHSAEDVAQEAFLRAQQRWEKVAAFDKPGAWVRRVAINLAHNGRDRRRSEASAMVRLARRPALMPAEPDVEEFWSVVRTLPRQQAAAVALHYLEDRSVAEVAAAMGCAEGTAKVHLSRGRAALARRLEEELAP